MKAKKMKETFLKREMKKCIFGRNPKAPYLMTNTWVVQKTYILAVCLEEEWLLYLSSVLRNMSYK